jgi:hypothetical protein
MSFQKYKCYKHLEVRGMPMIDLELGEYACPHCISNVGESSENPNFDIGRYMMITDLFDLERGNWKELNK